MPHSSNSSQSSNNSDSDKYTTVPTKAGISKLAVCSQRARNRASSLASNVRPAGGCLTSFADKRSSFPTLEARRSGATPNPQAYPSTNSAIPVASSRFRLHNRDRLTSLPSPQPSSKSYPDLSGGWDDSSRYPRHPSSPQDGRRRYSHSQKLENSTADIHLSRETICRTLPSPRTSLTPIARNTPVAGPPHTPYPTQAHAPLKTYLYPISLPKPSNPQETILCIQSLLPVGTRIASQLDLDDVWALYDRETMEVDVHIRTHAEDDSFIAVFGMPLRRVCTYPSPSSSESGAPNGTILKSGGKTYIHGLPPVLYQCVEELSRRDTSQERLPIFREPPDRGRLLQLITFFDQGFAGRYGDDGPACILREESTPDVCALLATYVNALPEPVLPTELFESFWVWCVKPSLLEDEDNEHHQNFSDTSSSHESPAESEVRREQLARFLLTLLPRAHLAILGYLISFFRRVVCVRRDPEAIRAREEDIGRVFALGVFGAGNVVGNKGVGDAGKRSERMLVWFLRRWGRIEEGLDNILGAGVQSGLGTQLEEVEVKAEVRGRQQRDVGVMTGIPICDDDAGTGVSESIYSLPLPSAGLFEMDNMSVYSASTHASIPEVYGGAKMGVDDQSQCSSNALNERLLDISLPNPFPSASESIQTQQSLDYLDPGSECGQEAGNHLRVMNRTPPIALLSDALFENHKPDVELRLEVELERTRGRIQELESALGIVLGRGDWKEEDDANESKSLTEKQTLNDNSKEEATREGLERRLADVERERDDALRVVGEMRRLLLGRRQDSNYRKVFRNVGDES